MSSNINSPEQLGSIYIPYSPPAADSSTAQIARDEKTDAAGQITVAPPTEQEANAIHGYCNTTTEYIDKLRHPDDLPDLENLKKKELDEASGDKGDTGEADKRDATGEVETKGDDKRTQKVSDPKSTEGSKGTEEVQENDKKSEEEEKKKKKQIKVDLGAIFTPMADQEEIVSPGKTVCHIEGTVTGPDVDKLSPEEKEALKEVAKRIAQNQVAKSSGMPLGIEDDGTLTSPSMMKVVSIADGGELSGQKPLSVKGVDESKPFESSMTDGEGGEKEKAEQYLKDHPDSPDAGKVKKRIERLENNEDTKVSDKIEDSEVENKTGEESATQNSQGAQGPPKIGEVGETQKGQETKGKKLKDINIETFFTPLVRAGDVVTPGRSIGHFEIKVTGKDADRLDDASKERIKQDAMQLVEKGSGRTMGIPQDGNLPADSMMRIAFIAANGKLESGQKVLSVQGLDGRHPFESYMKEEGGDELQKAKQYLRDNPDAPDADEVKKKVEKLEKERAFGVRDFGTMPAEEEED